MDKFLTPIEARNMIVSEAGNKIFGVIFQKRTNGHLRSMQCRLHVGKGIMGGTVSVRRWEQDQRCRLITVYDMNKREGDKRGAFRRINLDAVLVLKLNGVQYRTTDAYKTIEEIERQVTDE